MKRFSLLTAAALLASTPLFAMDGGGVSISGEANFGVKFKEHANEKDGDPSELQFHHEFKVTFAASGTTDGGIGFGGSMTLDNTESVGVGTKGAKAGTPITLLKIEARETQTGQEFTGADAVITVGDDDADTFVEINDKGKITYVGETGGENRYKLGKDPDNATSVIIVVDGKPVLVPTDDIGGAGDIWGVTAANGEAGTAAVANGFLYKVGPGVGPMNAATAASFDPDASNKIDNHGEVYISMDMHKLTIGSDLDAADKVAGGLADPGFDGIGIDDVAEGVWGKSAADVRYDGDFGVASVAISYGDNKGDAEWAAGFSFNVEPVTVGAGFDSNGVMSIGMGFSQGLISMNALYSTDSDHDEADNEARKPAAATENKDAINFERSNKGDLKNQAIGLDMTYQMSEATSLVLVAAQHKKESASPHYTRDSVDGDGTDVKGADSRLKQTWAVSETTIDAFGVGFSHDLGGGATLKAGAGSVDSNATADLGITMKF